MLKKAIIALFLFSISQVSFGMFCRRRCRRTAKLKSAELSKKIITPIYKFESIRTAAIRCAMASACLYDGTCNEEDAMVLTLALASLFTSLAYDANSDQRCRFIPKKFNMVADGIATVASTDAGYLPFTNSYFEKMIRSTVGSISMLTTALSFLPE